MDFDHKYVKVALNEDRFSSLPLELIHQILSRFDTKFVVETCLLLSLRWKLIWTSMPCLNFSSNEFKTLPKFAKFVKHVLSHRNHKVEVSSVKLRFYGAATQVFVKKIVSYVFSHNVQQLTVVSCPTKHHEFPPCLFSSQTLKNLTFRTYFFTPCLTPKTPWDFPALTTLFLDDISLCDDRRESIDLFSKCVNLQNLTLESFRVKAKVVDIITPRLSNLKLIKGEESIVINVVAPQLDNITINDCDMKDLIIPSGLSSFYYQGDSIPKWLKQRFISVNKVTFILDMYWPKMPYKQKKARGIINVLQQLHSAKFLTLNLDIVECLSSFPVLLSTQPSPFSNLIRLNIDSDTRDTCDIKMSTEARNFLLDNSPNATFIMKLLEDSLLFVKDLLQASLEQDNIIFERIQAIDKTKAVIENLVDDIQLWTKKKMFQIESERDQTEEFVAKSMARFWISLGEWSEMFDQEIDDLEPLISKEEHVRCLLDRLPKRQRNQMEARYSRPLEQVEALIARTDSHKFFIKKIGDVIRKNESSTSEDVSSFKHPLPSQPSSSCSSTIA